MNRHVRRFVAAVGIACPTAAVVGSNTYAPAGRFTGITNLFRPLPPNTGLLANAGNSGEFHSSHFAVVPEGSAQIGYDLPDRIRSTVGYTFQYWTNVKRAGDQIAIPTVTATGFPTLRGTSVRSAFPDQGSDFTVQGLTFGVELRY